VGPADEPAACFSSSSKVLRLGNPAEDAILFTRFYSFFSNKFQKFFFILVARFSILVLDKIEDRLHVFGGKQK
jgi:hypothetical protein